MSEMSKNPAVQVAGEISISGDPEELVTLAHGIRAKLHPITAALVMKVTGKIVDPKVPMWMDPDKGREIENPSDPTYLSALEAANQERIMATMDAAMMFGVELLDPIPDDGWEQKLKYLGIDFDAGNPLEREMAYKQFVAVANKKVKRVMMLSGMQQEDVADEIGKTFPDKP